MEQSVIDWLISLFGYPSEARGILTSGGSMANFSAVVTARRAKLPEDFLGGVLYVTEQTHASVAKAASLAGFPRRAVRSVPVRDYRMNVDELRVMIRDDRAAGHQPFMVVASAGTTNTGSVDPIAEVAELCELEGLWLHVDGAYGGAGMLAPELRPRYDGIEQADSLVMDPHKWWFAPFDSAALLYRDPRLAKAVHTQDASYLDVIHEHESDINPSDLAYHLTRRARGLPLWFSMAVNGIGAYREAVQHSLEMARYAAARLSTHPDCELIRDPDLSVVLFRRRGWGHAEYEAWSHTLLEAQRAFVTSSGWRGEIVGRLVFLHPATTTDMVDEVITALG